MKTLSLILLYLTLNTVIVCAEDFHLVETTIHGDLLVPRGAPATNSIYVLLLPVHNDSGAIVYINPVVLKTFDAEEIGRIISFEVARGLLPGGSVLHLDPGVELEGPPEAQVKALKDYCKKIGITLTISLTQ